MTFSENGLMMTRQICGSVHDIFQEWLDDDFMSSSVCIDDILVYSRTVEEHVETPTFIKGILFHKLREQIPIVCQVLEMRVWCTRSGFFLGT